MQRREYGSGGLSKVKKTRTRTLANGETVTHEYDYWCASLSTKDETGKRVFIRGYGESKREAQRRLRDNMQSRMQNGHTARTAHAPRLSQYLDTWLETAGDQNTTSKHRNRRNLAAHVLPYLDKPLNLITINDVQELFFKTLPKHAVTESSRYNAFASLRALLNFAVRMEVIEKNPCAAVQVKKPAPKVRANDDLYVNKRLSISKSMLKWLYEPSNPYHDDYPRILLMYSGLRRAELLGLTWDCIKNLEKKNKAYILVKQQLMGPETGQGWHIEPRTKTGQTRTVPLPEIMRRALIEQKTKRREAVEPWARDLVFLTPKGRWIDYNTHRNKWEEVLSGYINKNRKEPRALDETEYFRPHVARRLCTNLLSEAGIPLEVAKDILGHKTVGMTEYYNSRTRAQSRSAAQAIDSVLQW